MWAHWRAFAIYIYICICICFLLSYQIVQIFSLCRLLGGPSARLLSVTRWSELKCSSNFGVEMRVSCEALHWTWTLLNTCLSLFCFFVFGFGRLSGCTKIPKTAKIVNFLGGRVLEGSNSERGPCFDAIRVDAFGGLWLEVSARFLSWGLQTCFCWNLWKIRQKWDLHREGVLTRNSVKLDFRA